MIWNSYWRWHAAACDGLVKGSACLFGGLNQLAPNLRVEQIAARLSDIHLGLLAAVTAQHVGNGILYDSTPIDPKKDQLELRPLSKRLENYGWIATDFATLACFLHKHHCCLSPSYAVAADRLLYGPYAVAASLSVYNASEGPDKVHAIACWIYMSCDLLDYLGVKKAMSIYNAAGVVSACTFFYSSGPPWKT